MNPRIRELALQAEDYYYTEYYFHTEYDKKRTGCYTREDFFKSKFAELLVKECIEVVEDSEGYSQYFPHVARNIKKHFGVKR